MTRTTSLHKTTLESSGCLGVDLQKTPTAHRAALTANQGVLSLRIDEATPIDVMSERLRHVCGEFEVIPTHRQTSVLGGIVPKRLGGVDAVIVSQNVERIHRDAQCIRRDPGDHYFLIFQDYGQSLMCQDSMQVQMSPGDVVLIDSTKPSSFIYSGNPSQQVSVHLPREEMQHRFGRKIENGLGILKQDALGLAMRAVLAKILFSNSNESGYLKETFLSIFASVLHERNNASCAARLTNKEALLGAAMQQISLQFQDPHFNAAKLAALLNVPQQSLQRIFKGFGETPSRRILNTRLNASYERLMLQSGSPHTHYVSSVAYSCGFNDLSFFYREFRKKFATTPGSIANPE